ncbi:hypothetical protein ACFPN1_16270 [Lysobacter yangpyeongensis]|uniref:Uncharacterized protein n=1 Tax=Lysobacter yangpyeongensis TaxID=346182 RepID=A0ABW0SRZ9_9GAMM
MLNFLYGSTPATFESRYSLGESVERLRSATTSWSPTNQIGVGKVSESKVVLQRSIPFVRNSFKPFFVGNFERSGHGVVLVGRFTMHWVVKTFLTFWFGFCLLWTVLATAAVASSQDTLWWFPFAGIGMLAAGAAIVQLGKYFARNDIAWLSKVIEAALSRGAA